MFEKKLKGAPKKKELQGKWILKEGDESGIVLSSRVRFARNLNGFPFPRWAQEEDLKKVREILNRVISRDSSLKQLEFYLSEELSDLDQRLLLEEYLISSNFIANRKDKGAEIGQALLLDRNAGFSLIVNEEDHLRIQWLVSGLNPRKAWSRLREIETKLNSQLKFAFSDKFGYLSAYPADVGTAMRVSLVLHLPALTLRNEIGELLAVLDQEGIMVRGLFEEGTSVLGNLHQISNRATLGITEEEIIDKLIQVGKEIIEKEKRARKIILRENRREITDSIQRSIGILTHAQLISFEEAVELLSMVRLGIELSLVTRKIKFSHLNALNVLIQTAHLKDYLGRDLDEEEESKIRADLIRERLKV